MLSMRALSDELEVEGTRPKRTPYKRKRPDGDADDEDTATPDSNETRVARRAKRRTVKANKKASAQAEDANIDEELQVNMAIGRMDQALLADHAFRQLKRYEPRLSELELEELRLPQASFMDTSMWDMPRTLDHMGDFIDRFSGKAREELATAPAVKGAPHTLVVCPAAIRAADVTRPLRCYQSKHATVGKLFAKHIKLKEAIDFTKKTRMSVGVGTPQRLLDLVAAGALSLAHVERVVLDGSWCGAKRRTIFEQVEAIGPAMQFLARPELKARYGRGGALGLTILVY